jgi:diguanylate cyclase
VTVGSPISPEMILVLLLLVLLQLPGPRRLAHLAAHDPLTGLANRALFADRLDRALARARREGRPGALLLLDLDGFKAINDARGHAAGDRALVAVAGRLRGCVREVDTVARLGGDEFLVVLDGVEAAAEARRVAGRIRAALAEPLRLDGDGAPLALGASIGVAVFAGREAPADLLRRADGAMYVAKRTGEAVAFL